MLTSHSHHTQRITTYANPPPPGPSPGLHLIPPLFNVVIFVEDRVVDLPLYGRGRHEVLEQARVRVALDDRHAPVSLQTHRDEVAVAVDCVGKQARESQSVGYFMSFISLLFSASF
jgi:hypothetical protein